MPGFGADLKREIKRHFPAWVELHPFGETLPYADNRITTDESQPDRYGLPMLKIDYRIRENERKMTEHIYDTLEEIGKTAGIEWVHFTRGELDSNGSAIHEHGCCRMGEDPKRSALNKFNQMHEVKNVFVVDGSAFTSASEKNPTLDDSGALVARVRLPRRGDQTGESLIPSDAVPSDCIVVGGGAAGLMAAIMAARGGARVLVLDSARRLGAKILISGGGRCNVTNRIVTAADFWGGSRSTIARVLSAWTVDDTVRFFADAGVPLHEEARGKLFPDANTSRVVLNALLAQAARCRRGHRDRLARGPDHRRR